MTACEEPGDIPVSCRLSTYDYHLPKELIAHEPSERRDKSRLLLIHKISGQTSHHEFGDLEDLLSPSDLLVINETRVVPAALFGNKPTGGRVELLVLDPAAPDRQPCEGVSSVRTCMVKSSKPLKDGDRILLNEGVELLVEEAQGGGRVLVRFPVAESRFLGFLDSHGMPPLPPYISRKERVVARDLQRYQTVYSKVPGSVAAPTAGLHFTPELMSRLRERGIEIARVLLHVGAGTFTPVRTEDARLHRMQPEYYEITDDTAKAVSLAVAQGRRVVAVGTTTVRVLEATADEKGAVQAGTGWTDLFIRPGYTFKVVGGLVTNFHLPKSTLLMLTCAFGGTGRVLTAYKEAAENGYRFYSYGDVSVIIS